MGVWRNASIRRLFPSPQGLCSLQRWGGDNFINKPPNVEKPCRLDLKKEEWENSRKMECNKRKEVLDMRIELWNYRK